MSERDGIEFESTGRRWRLSKLLHVAGPCWYEDATAADIIAALQANPQLRAEVLAQMPEMMPDAVDAEGNRTWQPRACVPEMAGELSRRLREVADLSTKLRAAESDRLRYQQERDHYRSRAMSAESELAAERARVGELEAPVRRGKMMATWFLSNRYEGMVRRFPVIAQVARDLESFECSSQQPDQTPASTTEEQATPAQQDHAPLGQKEETDNERDSARGLRRLRGFHGVEELRRQPNAEVARAAGEDSRGLEGSNPRSDGVTPPQPVVAEPATTAEQGQPNQKPAATTEEQATQSDPLLEAELLILSCGPDECGSSETQRNAIMLLIDAIRERTDMPSSVELVTRADVLSLLLELARAAEANRFAKEAPLLALVETLEKAKEAGAT